MCLSTGLGVLPYDEKLAVLIADEVVWLRINGGVAGLGGRERAGCDM